MNVSDFDYHLPPELIAQEPVEPRDSSRLLVVERQTKTISHAGFKDIIKYLGAGDCLVVNNARVLPARLIGNKAGTNGKVELLLLSEVQPGKWEVLAKPGRRLPPGAVVNFDSGALTAIVEQRMPEGKRLVSFECQGEFRNMLHKLGQVPLPPYIHKPIADPGRYQTVYANRDGAVAAPTAGLHFTEELLRNVRDKGVRTSTLTLDVGLDSFRPVKFSQVEEHQMHSEKLSLSQESADLINEATRKGGRVFAVGTTSARVLETMAAEGRRSQDESTDRRWAVKAADGSTKLFIYPGYEFKIVDALLTNFHLPKSTLLMLVCAFASRELIMEAYRQAIEKRYRFFSFGDAMLIL